MHLQHGGAGLLSPTQGALPPFELLRPRDLTEALAALREWPDATIAAGCTDLIASIREGLVPSTVLSLRGLDELRTVETVGDGLRIGALTTHDHGAGHPALLAGLPALGTAWSAIATVRIRLRATIGGNLVARRARYEMPVILGALGAVMEFGTPAGEHRCTVDEFVRRAGTAPTGPALLHHLHVDTTSLRTFGYDRSMRPVTTVALAVRLRGPELELTAAVGSEYRPAVVVRTRRPGPELDSAELADVAHDLAGRLPDGIGDYVGSAAYRRRVVAVLLRRQLEARGPRP